MIGSVFCLWLAAPAPARAQPTCIGDCNNSKTVAVNEIIECVNIALGTAQLTTCPACSANGSTVQVPDLITAVNNALNGCPGTTPKPTSTGGATLTPTVTPVPTGGTPCPLLPGKYTLTSGKGSTLTVSTLQTFAFPAGGMVIEDVSPATFPECIHSVVVPFPGGFSSPIFCIQTLGYTVSVTQTACGIGQIASNGGGDYAVTELGDTSDTHGPCNSPQACNPGVDDSIRVQVKVGDGTPPTCVPPASVNAITAVPVFTVTWLEHSEVPPGQSGLCPGKTFDPPTDLLISQFPQTLDFTTDTSSAQFTDLDGDGCFLAGAGPAMPAPSSGTCMDLTKLNKFTKVCKKGTNPCTTDADCTNNTGPCDPGECQQDPSTGCTANADCIITSGRITTDHGPCLQPIGVPAVTTVASGTIGSNGVPLYDLSFATTLVNSITGPDAPLGATCASPPLIDFKGTVDRCIK